jgi:hypothetical protein
MNEVVDGRWRDLARRPTHRFGNSDGARREGPGLARHHLRGRSGPVVGCDRPYGQRHLVRGRTFGGRRGLWLAHHGRQTLINMYGVKRIQAAFLTTLRWPGVCVVPPGWDPDYGVGRVDLLPLLNAPLPGPQDLVQVGAFGTANDDAVSRIAAMISSDPVRVKTRLAELLNVSNHDELDQTIAEHEGELVYLVLADRAFATSLAQPGAVGAFPPKINVAGVTTDLAIRLAS